MLRSKLCSIVNQWVDILLVNIVATNICLESPRAEDKSWTIHTVDAIRSPVVTRAQSRCERGAILTVRARVSSLPRFPFRHPLGFPRAFIISICTPVNVSRRLYTQIFRRAYVVYFNLSLIAFYCVECKIA